MSVVKNSIISISAKLIELIISVISAIVLARLLEPKDFGSFGIIMAVNILFVCFLDVGLTSAFIKTDRVTEQLKNSFFTVNVLLGFVTTTLLLISAPIIASVYNNVELLYLMTVFSISALITSLGMQGISQLTRDKEFYKLMLINLITSSITVIITVWVALKGGGVWTFNCAAICRASILTILVFCYVDGKYKILNYKTVKLYAKEFRFGLQIFIGRLLSGVFHATDKLLLGGIVDQGTLGQYMKSQQHARLTDTHIRVPIGSVVYSYIERFTEKNKKETYSKYAIITMIITIMANGPLFIEGRNIITYVFGIKWMAAGEYIRYFSIFSMGIIFKGIYTTILMSEDKMNKMNMLTAISVFVLFAHLLSYYITKYSLMLFITYLSVNIFLLWTFLLSLEFYCLNKNNQFLKYLIISICVVGVCDILKHSLVNGNELQNFFLVLLLFEATMGLLLLFYCKQGIKVKHYK